MNVALFTPWGAPFTYHSYDGANPPFVGVAVNVTDVPWQTGLTDGAMDTLTGKAEVTTIVMALEVAGFPVGHEMLDVITQVTTCPLMGTNV